MLPRARVGNFQPLDCHSGRNRHYAGDRVFVRSIAAILLSALAHADEQRMDDKGACVVSVME
jgi:hypothetical protein